MKKILYILALAFSSLAVAEPLKLLVPYSPGGSGDQTARYLAKSLSDLGHETIVVNKPAGGGVAALADTVNATDNKTIMLVGNGIVIAKPLEDDKVAEQVKKLVPLIHVCSYSNIIVASKQSGIRNWKDLQKELKNRKINLASSSPASTALTNYLFSDYPSTASVSYNGDAKLLPDLLSGQIDVANMTYISAVPQIEAGMIVPIALTMDHKFNNLPTLRNVGVNFSTEGFFGIMVGPGMSDTARKEYDSLLSKILSTPESRDFFKSIHSIVPRNSGSQDFAKLLEREHNTLSKIIVKK